MSVLVEASPPHPDSVMLRDMATEAERKCLIRLVLFFTMVISEIVFKKYNLLVIPPALANLLKQVKQLFPSGINILNVNDMAVL
jgi:hypothetical protein